MGAPERPTSPPLPAFPADGLRSGAALVRPWRPERPAEVEARHRLVLLPDVRRWSPVFTTPPHDLAATRTRLERAAERAAAGEPADLAVCLADDPDVVLGDIGWRFDLPPFRWADLGYAVLPEARGRGLARGALDALAAWLLEAGDLPRVQLDHGVGNDASCRVALSAGFAREGVRRAYLPLPDATAADGVRWTDSCLHGRLPGDPVPHSTTRSASSGWRSR